MASAPRPAASPILVPEPEADNYSSSDDSARGGGTAVFGNDFSVVAAASRVVKAQPRDHQVDSLLAKKVNLSQRALSDVAHAEKSGHAKNQGRDDRATTEQVMDPRTRLVLFKMLARGLFDEIHGCVSTGKEANVYHATTPEGAELAVKVYKTSILVFRDRDKYVSGDHRFKSGYGRGNPRKMVKMWAEKELKNLNRLHACGVPCPQPRTLKDNVLVMEFIGSDGWPAPRLKDALVDADRMRACYLQTVRMMRVMFHRCRLVHGDLSEYNMLYFRKQVVFIDVSQSVELDHPRALDFLRVDCVNVTRFFFKSGVANALSAKQLFDFVVDASFGCDDEAEMDDALERLACAAVDDEAESVFMQSTIPRSLHEVDDADDVVARAAQAGGDRTAAVAAVARMTAAAASSPSSSSSSSGEEGSEGDGDDNAEWNSDGKPAKADDGVYRVRTADADAKRAHKAAVKAAKAEQRKHKIPKAAKKRILKKT